MDHTVCGSPPIRWLTGLALVALVSTYSAGEAAAQTAGDDKSGFDPVAATGNSPSSLTSTRLYNTGKSGTNAHSPGARIPVETLFGFAAGGLVAAGTTLPLAFLFIGSGPEGIPVFVAAANLLPALAAGGAIRGGGALFDARGYAILAIAGAFGGGILASIPIAADQFSTAPSLGLGTAWAIWSSAITAGGVTTYELTLGTRHPRARSTSRPDWQPTLTLTPQGDVSVGFQTTF